MPGRSRSSPPVCRWGGTAPLDEVFQEQVKRFLDEYGITLYTEHLSWCSDEGHLYDLLPIPFTEEAVHHVAARIRRTQEILERRILLAGRPELNPTARLAHYRYPVHRIGPQFEPAGPDGQACCYLVYRGRHDTVRFITLNPVSARLLELIRDDSLSGYEAMTQIARELDQDDPESLFETGRALLDTLREAGAVY